MANPVGRPRTTVDDLPEDWKQIMLDCGQEGGSAVEARCLLGIGTSAWETLLEDSEEFRVTEKTRQALCEVWWERTGRKMVQGADGNATVWIFNMKNRFGWRDKQEIDHQSSDGTMTPKPLDTSKLSNESLSELMNVRNSSDPE
jgi:hypothetical protein